jgi:hypothetical protein
MRTRILLAVALAISLTAVPVATGQPGTRARTLDISVRMAVIEQIPGTSTKFAGEAVGRPVGRSGLVIKTVADGSEVVGQGVVYAKGGTVRATTRNEVQPQPDGSVRFVGTYKITGGTRRFKGATGSGKFNGVLPANSTVYDIDLDGKIRY